MRIRVLKAYLVSLWLITGIISSNAICEIEEVNGEGCAPVYENLAVSRDEAMRQAKRNAIENAIGVYVNTETHAENFQLAYQKIITESAGYIDNYELLIEEERNDLFCVNIAANVITHDAVKDILNESSSMCYLQQDVDKPRIMIVVSEKIDGEFVDRPSSEAQIYRILSEKCFNLIDKGQLEQIKARDTLRAGVGDNDENLPMILEIAQDFGAEYLVAGSAESFEDSCWYMEDQQMWSCEGRVEARMFSAETGKVVASDEKVRGGVSASNSKGMAKRVGLSNAAKPLTNYFIERIVDSWMVGHGAGACRSILLVIEGATARQYRDIYNHFDQEREVCKAYQRGFSGSGISRIEIEAEYNGNELFNRLLDTGVAGIEFDITNSSLNRLDIKVIR